MSCNNPENVIVRFRGDDDLHELLLQVKKSGSNELTPLDLDLVSKVEFAFTKDASTTVIYQCIKNADSKSGLVEVPFVASDVDTAGTFPYDIQVTWAANSRKRTILKSTLELEDDVNKN